MSSWKKKHWRFKNIAISPKKKKTAGLIGHIAQTKKSLLPFPGATQIHRSSKYHKAWAISFTGAYSAKLLNAAGDVKAADCVMYSEMFLYMQCIKQKARWLVGRSFFLSSFSQARARQIISDDDDGWRMKANEHCFFHFFFFLR